MSKWDGRRRRPLIPNEFQQMAGRAGRRGMDGKGTWSFPTARGSRSGDVEIATGPLHPVRSAFTMRYNTVLNLWDPPQGERVRQYSSQSLLQFQTNRRVREPRLDLMALRSGSPLLEGLPARLRGRRRSAREYRALGRGTETGGDAGTAGGEDESRVLTMTDDRPWKEPTRHVLRQVFRRCRSAR